MNIYQQLSILEDIEGLLHDGLIVSKVIKENIEKNIANKHFAKVILNTILNLAPVLKSTGLKEIVQQCEKTLGPELKIPEYTNLLKQFK